MRLTNEGAYAYEHSLDHALEFFSKAGSLFERRQSFYGQEETALGLFQKIYIVDKPLAMRLLFWLRDCRGGAGNRSGARSIYKWLAEKNSTWLAANLQTLPEVGRWDDLRSLFGVGSKLERRAAQMWATAIVIDNNVLAAKWADRKDKELLFELRSAGALNDIGEFRRLLAKVRKGHIVEYKMCSGLWKEIEYKKVPSVAMARYTNAFGRHDPEGFEKYKESLKKGETTVHADVLFPHDCVRTVKYGDAQIAEAQFDALPNYMEGTDEKVIVISDTSGSMSTRVSGSIEAVDISQGLALYCSAKIPEDNPFHKKFIGFCSESSFKDWNGMTFVQAVKNRRIFDGAVGGTYIHKALDSILQMAKFFNLTQTQMPTMLLIVSDMQFHSGAAFRCFEGGCESKTTEIERCLQKWDKANYQRPKIVYWNTAGYFGQQTTADHKDVGLVSGFSPSLLRSILTGEDFSPVAIMMRALEKYEINYPMNSE